MRILAIETVEASGSVAALDDQNVVAEFRIDPAIRTARSLVPTIGQLLDRARWRASEVQLVAAASGPGSFTGLRIGVTTAKTFAYAVGCQAIGVHSLLAIAWRVPADLQDVSVVLDAGRNELFVADFRRGAGGKMDFVGPTRLLPWESWFAALVEGQNVTGPALSKLPGPLPRRAVTVDRSLWTPAAAEVGRIGWHAWQSGLGRPGQTATIFELQPLYFRRTAAEEQWERRQGS